MGEVQRARRVGLSRERVLAAALAIVDAEGLEALSLRHLAAGLGVTPMAIYRHVESKEELVDGIGDLILGELELPDVRGGQWQEELRVTARSFRALLVAHPAAMAIFTDRPLFTPAALRTANAMLGLLRGAGFSPEDAALRYQQIVRFLLAIVATEPGTGSGPDDASGRRRRRMLGGPLEEVPPDRYPHLAEAAPYLAMPDAERAFATGVELLIAGLDSALAAGRRRPS